MDAALATDLSRIVARSKWPQSFRMRLWYIDDNSLRLQPANTQCSEELRLFRNAVAEETGIYWPDHDRYVFHMTYAYRLQELEEDEAQEFRKLTFKQEGRFRQHFREFEMPAGVFCNFRNMIHFQPYALR